jgi:hypothetical protein
MTLGRSKAAHNPLMIRLWERSQVAPGYALSENGWLSEYSLS